MQTKLVPDKKLKRKRVTFTIQSGNTITMVVFGASGSTIAGHDDKGEYIEMPRHSIVDFVIEEPLEEDRELIEKQVSAAIDSSLFIMVDAELTVIKDLVGVEMTQMQKYALAQHIINSEDFRQRIGHVVEDAYDEAVKELGFDLPTAESAHRKSIGLEE